MSERKQEDKNSDDDSSYDETLDFTSEKFDPLKALYSSRVKVPVPNAVTLDNLAKYASLRKQFQQGSSGGSSLGNPLTSSSDSRNQATSSSSSASYRRFLPHQEMIPGRVRPPKQNLLTRMPTAGGPFGRLWEAVGGEPRGRVRVVTRDERGIHGRLEGYVVIFDKHWNLAMSDVTEVFYRTVPQRAKDFFHGDPRQVDELSDRLGDLAVSLRLPAGGGRGGRGGRGAGTAGLPDPLDLVPAAELARGAQGKGRGKRTRDELDNWPPLPKVFYRAHGKRQECVRHVGQMLVRGEHVVYVQFLTPTQFEVERKASS